VNLKRHHRFEAAPEEVWSALHEPDLMHRALPPLERLEPRSDGGFELTLDVGVGAVRGVYDGTLALGELAADGTTTGRLIASAAHGGVEAGLAMSVRPEEAGGRCSAMPWMRSYPDPLPGSGSG
jgi:uncharacterized protein